MANRFDKTYEQQPWVSSYVPLPLKEIEEGYKGQQKKYDDAMAAVADAPVITGGNSTKEVAAKMEAEKNKYITEQVEEASKTKDYGQLPNKIKMYKNKLEADPFYQGIVLDKTLSPKADAVLIGDKDRQVAQTFYDYDKGEYEQVTDKPFTADHYAAMAPPDTQTIFKPYYEQLDNVITQTFDKTPGQQLNPDGTVTSFLNGEKVTRSLTRDELRKFAEPLMRDDPSFKALAPFGYGRLRHKQLFGKDYVDANGVVQRGSQWDDYNDPIDIFLDNYLHNKYEKEEITKPIRTSKLDDEATHGARAGGGGGGVDSEDKGDNIWLRTLTQLDTPTVVQNPDGTYVQTKGIADADQITVDALVGADTKTHVVDLTGRKIILSAAQQSPVGAETIENRKVVALNDNYTKALEDAKKSAYETVEGAKNTPSAPGTSPASEMTDKYLKEKYKLTNGQTLSWEVIDPFSKNPEGLYIVNADGSKKLTSETRESSMKDLEANIAKNDPRVKAAKLDAIKAGYDLDSPKAKKIIENESKKPLEEITLNKALEAGMLNGEYTFIAAKDKRNIFTDKESNAYGSGYIKMNEKQLDNIPGLDSTEGFDFWNTIDKGWRKLLKTDENTSGIILKATDENGQVYYKVPVSLQSVEDVKTLVSNVQLGKYGTDAKTQGQIPAMQTEALDKQNYMKATAQEANIKEALDKGIYKSYTDLGIDKYKDAPIVAATLKIIDAMPNGVKKNEEIADLWLMIDNYQAWSKKHDKGPSQFTTSVDQSGNTNYYYNGRPIQKSVYDANVPKQEGKPASGTRK